ncbi:hypothetical protein DPM13_03615 [Paracoccus mutanolyticus]|uniref:Transposase IS66 central domain-containing protein n=1 Tax=Paracoccus mutanolyticus TaxID=1499308 RepID=A0ABM6WUN4_9RHOB|nr:hypothetical protein DPM13_03615 [Paracoccus mutanolyticus]
MVSGSCWAHLRRDFHDAWTLTKCESARGQRADRDRADLIGQPADVRRGTATPESSQARSVEAFRVWAEQRLTRIPGKSDLAGRLTTEEEGIGYLAGACRLGGERGALLMQSSGVGNCINTLALQAMARFPLLMVVTMRGDWAEFNAWQNPPPARRWWRPRQGAARSAPAGLDACAEETAGMAAGPSRSAADRPTRRAAGLPVGHRVSPPFASTASASVA